MNTKFIQHITLEGGQAFEVTTYTNDNKNNNNT